MDVALFASIVAVVAVIVAITLEVRNSILMSRVERLVDLHENGPPTEEIQIPPTMSIGARAPEWNERMRIKKPPGAW
jgi:hypothetical protein